MCSWK
ncbi:Uncharacterised protein g9787 [Pycnogonum litorale]